MRSLIPLQRGALKPMVSLYIVWNLWLSLHEFKILFFTEVLWEHRSIEYFLDLKKVSVPFSPT